jgi:hypothetical protein
MTQSIQKTAILVVLCLSGGLSAWGQYDNGAADHSRQSIDFGMTFAAERSNAGPGNCGCFWFNGGGADTAATFWKGLGLAATVTGGHASNISPGVDVSKISFLAGPRYTFAPRGWKGHHGFDSRWQVFGQGLIGAVRAFDSPFPSTTGITTSADSFALQTGGGLNVLFSKRIGLRVLEADYVRTTLPNYASNVQNDFRLGIGVTYHVGSGWQHVKD